jgi:hypothetical protein
LFKVAGDVVACSAIVSTLINGIKAAVPSAIITMAPQMPDIYSEIPSVSLGMIFFHAFNSLLLL